MGLQWHRFRDGDSTTWNDREDWPVEDILADLIVYNACDGFHFWDYGDQFTPPGTHYAVLEPCAEARKDHEETIAAYYGGKSPLE